MRTDQSITGAQQDMIITGTVSGRAEQGSESWHQEAESSLEGQRLRPPPPAAVKLHHIAALD